MIMNKVEILKTDRGGLKIVFNEYMYTKQVFLLTTKLDEMSVQKKKRKNVGSITTDQSILNVLKNIEHENHPPSSTQVEVTKAMLNMNIGTKAQNNFDTPSRVFAEETSNLSNEAMVLLTDEKSIKRSLRRIRNKKYPSQLCPLLELKINSNWATIGGAEPKQFLLFDNENNINRIIYCFRVSRRNVRVVKMGQVVYGWNIFYLS